MPRQRLFAYLENLDIHPAWKGIPAAILGGKSWLKVPTHMVETEALFRQQEVLGPLCSGPETRIILFLQLQLNV